jgi:hypothetical protein
MKRASKKLPPLPVRAARVLARLKHLRGLDDGEKSLHALGLAAGTVGTLGVKRPFVRLLDALEAEQIGYVVIGMDAAIAQGVLTVG